MAMAAGLPDDLRRILEPGERIIWLGRPSRAPFILKSLSTLFLVLPVMVFPLPILLSFPRVLRETPVAAFFTLWYGLALLIGAGAPIYGALVWKNLRYLVTDRRIIIRKGLVGIDYDVLDLSLVQQVNVDVGFWDRRYGTGTITVSAVGVKPVQLFCVPDPL